MPQKFAFTTAAMAAALEETGVSYEDLAEMEREFDDAETEIIRQQITLTTPLYLKRHILTSKIPNFWPLVLEQAPPDIDQYIQPSDSALLLSSLASLSVSHFEVDISPKSFKISFEFAPNDVFEDTKLEKCFWYRKAKDGWAGFVSEPVQISWKKGRDLTGGLLDLVVKAEKSRAVAQVDSTTKRTLTEDQKALKKKIDNTGMGGLSFFAWFGFIGRRISAEESAEAVEKEKERRRNGKLGVATEEEEEEEEDLGMDMELEIFPDGDELAIAISDDLWPGAVKYFTQAQEQDALSDADFESDDEDGEGDEPADNSESGEEDAGEERPKKKMRSN